MQTDLGFTQLFYKISVVTWRIGITIQSVSGYLLHVNQGRMPSHQFIHVAVSLYLKGEQQQEERVATLEKLSRYSFKVCRLHSWAGIKKTSRHICVPIVSESRGYSVVTCRLAHDKDCILLDLHAMR